MPETTGSTTRPRAKERPGARGGPGLDVVAVSPVVQVEKERSVAQNLGDHAGRERAELRTPQKRPVQRETGQEPERPGRCDDRVAGQDRQLGERIGARIGNGAGLGVGDAGQRPALSHRC